MITKLMEGLPNQSMAQVPFDEAVAKYMAELPAWGGEANALAADVNAKQVQTTTSAASAAASVDAAAAQVPAGAPEGYGSGTSFSPDTGQLAVATSVAPYLLVFRRSGDQFIPRSDMPSTAAGGRAMKWMLILVLAGCGSPPLAPQRVEVPVFAPCVKSMPQRPAYEFDQLPPTATDGETILALARDWPRGRKYEVELEAAIVGCQ